MADAAYSAERECVECGIHFPTVRRRGPVRRRCLTCSPIRPSKAPKRPQLRGTTYSYTCAGCAVAVETEYTSGARRSYCEPCAASRNEATKRNRHVDPHTCKGCGSVFTPKGRDRTTYCSRQCAFQTKSKAKAKWPNSPVKFVPCLICLGLFASRSGAKHCSDECRAEASRRYHQSRAVAAKHAIRSRPCMWCSAAFTPITPGKRFCGPVCARKHTRSMPTAKAHMRATRQRRKALLRGVTAERFDPLEILERDKWRCHLCGERTPKRLRGTYEANAPEVDHIIPLSKGGEHSRRNTACACRKCNLAKGDKTLGQLKLVA